MINYEQKEGFIRLKWKRTEIGRLYKENRLWHCRWRGCEGNLRTEGFSTLTLLKQYIEGETK
jgi:hypothetical protein